jgi:hypothetical protein
MMGTVTKMQSVIWTELAQLCENEQRHSADARTLWPAIAAHMAQLKKDYPSTEEFGSALYAHGIEYNKDDRAAFIWMGSLAASVLDDALARCERRSPRTFRVEVESWRDPYYQPSSQPCEVAPTDPLPAESSEIAASACEFSTVGIQESAKKNTKIADHQWGVRSKLFPLGDDGRLLQAIIGGKGAMGSVYPLMPKQKPFLRFVLDQIKAGRLTPQPFNSDNFHARHLVLALDRSFVREMVFSRKGEKPDAKACSLFMDHFDDVLQAAEKGWSYAEFRRVCKGFAHQTPATAEETWAKRPAVTPIILNLPAMATLMDGTVLTPEPIYVCGECLYPSEARPNLDYVAAYLYAHHCRELVTELDTRSVSDIGMSIASHGLWLGRHYSAIGGFMSAIGTAIRARGDTMDRALWFKLEAYRNRTSG